MPTYDAEAAECLIFTYKEGLLSAAAHDLRLVVTRLQLQVAEAPLHIDARFDAGSLRVAAAQRDGADDPSALSEGDRRKIERAIVEEVLDARRHPEIRFRSDRVTAEGEGYLIEGQLTLHGATRPLTLRSGPAAGGAQIAEVTLHQPDFGIRPYSALLGALKIRPDVRVRLRVPAPAATGAAAR